MFKGRFEINLTETTDFPVFERDRGTREAESPGSLNIISDETSGGVPQVFKCNSVEDLRLLLIKLVKDPLQFFIDMDIPLDGLVTLSIFLF